MVGDDNGIAVRQLSQSPDLGRNTGKDKNCARCSRRETVATLLAGHDQHAQQGDQGAKCEYDPAVKPENRSCHIGAETNLSGRHVTQITLC